MYIAKFVLLIRETTKYIAKFVLQIRTIMLYIAKFVCQSKGLNEIFRACTYKLECVVTPVKT